MYEEPIIRVLGIYSLFLIIFGTLSNSICFLICLTKQLRSIPTFTFLAFGVFIDTISLYFLNIDQFYKAYYGVSLKELSLFYCHSETFFHDTTVQIAAWLKVCFFFLK